MTRLNTEKRTQILRCLVEGNSIRGTSRITGRAKNTIIRLILELGRFWQSYQDKILTSLHCQRIQCDEIWTFCHTKEKNIPSDLPAVVGVGDLWMWMAFCPDTKLVPHWHLGRRDDFNTQIFMYNLAKRFNDRVQITTDGFRPYSEAVPQAFNGEVDFAMTVKSFGEPESRKTSDCVGIRKQWVCGNPDEKHISTSLVERQNLTLRMSIRRYARKTNAFSKSLENHTAAVAFFLMYYNFVRRHQTLKTTPAVAAGVTNEPWTVEALAEPSLL